MAEPSKDTKQFRNSVQHACAVIAAHPAVKEVGKPDYDGQTARSTFVVEVPLPNAWKADGVSPYGVMRFEEVRLDFPSAFPVNPPEPSLRSDFSRDLAHMQPWLTNDNRPVPCIQDGKMNEFFHQEGIRGLINQTVLWLEHAAEGRLIDEEQGWEPTRRDQICDYLIADDAALRNHVNKHGGFCFLEYEYLRIQNSDDIDLLHGEIVNKQVPLNKDSAKNIFMERPIGADGNLFMGKGLALIIWPGKKPSGEPVICDKYAPEDVTDLASLNSRAELFGCGKELADGFSRLKSCVKDYQKAGPFNLAIVLCVRRPFNLIGMRTSIELCMYFIDFNAGEAFPEGNKTPIKPAGHRDRISPQLLARLSGLNDLDNPTTWSLIGAGSLGSKLAMHMSRAGRAPVSIIDQSSISPHNLARHALIPPADDMQLRLNDRKSRLLSNAIKGFSQVTVPLDHDVVNVLNTRSLAKEAWPKGTWAIVNTTASLRVRAALSAAGDNLRSRVIENVLYASGNLGLIATEGPNRNPGLGDLFSQFYLYCKTDPKVREILFGTSNNDLERTVIGQGCGSSTMRMSDGQISLFAAACAEYLLSKQRDGLLEDDGELLVGVRDGNGLGVSWRQINVPQFIKVVCDNGNGWSVHISSEVVTKISQEVSQWSDVETGGVIIGRQEEISKTFHIVDVLPAPLDSTRSSNEFILGKEGIRKKLNEYSEDTNWSLYCLGTWHSHLNPSGPSGLDRQIAHAIGLARLAPSVLLIHTPEGFQALLADSYSSEEEKQ
ncbi:MAG: ThiF family adenylyltransferase [Candidatus Thiodiazotropha endolucinida]